MTKSNVCQGAVGGASDSPSALPETHQHTHRKPPPTAGRGRRGEQLDVSASQAWSIRWEDMPDETPSLPQSCWCYLLLGLDLWGNIYFMNLQKTSFYTKKPKADIHDIHRNTSKHVILIKWIWGVWKNRSWKIDRMWINKSMCFQFATFWNL